MICEVALELAQALAHLHSKNVIHGGEARRAANTLAHLLFVLHQDRNS